MSTFFSYAFSSNDMYYVKREYNLQLYPQHDDVEAFSNQVVDIVSQKTVEKYAIIKNSTLYVKKQELTSHYSERYKEVNKLLPQVEHMEKTDYESIIVKSLGEEEYQRFIKSLGLKYENCKNKVILLDDMKNYVLNMETEKGKYVLYRIYDYKKGDTISTIIPTSVSEDGIVEGERIELEIAAVSDKRPMGLEGDYYSSGYFIVSDEWMRNNLGNMLGEVVIEAKDPQKLENYIKDYYSSKFYINNYESMVQQENAMWLVIAIFLYGFITVISLIGVTNIFNTITTNMKLRSKEFANLKSVGMTKNEFNHMIRLESIFYCTKSLLIGIIIGNVLSYLIYKAFAEGFEMGYLLPIKGIIIASVAVVLLITVIMKYSLNKINEQNIIETIRNENI